MNNSELESRITELEKRVANLKNWKSEYETNKSIWEQERINLLKTTRKQGSRTSKLRDALIEFLGIDENPNPALATKDTINVNHQELAINVTYKQRTLDLATTTIIGKIVFVASTELNKDGFTENDISKALLEHGWNVGHNTLAPTLGGLIKDGTLMKLDGRPSRYRLPRKITLHIEGKP